MRIEQTYVRYEKFSYIKDFQQKEKVDLIDNYRK